MWREIKFFFSCFVNISLDFLVFFFLSGVCCLVWFVCGYPQRPACCCCCSSSPACCCWCCHSACAPRGVAEQPVIGPGILADGTEVPVPYRYPLYPTLDPAFLTVQNRWRTVRLIVLPIYRVCGSAFIFCEFRSGSSCFLKADPDPAAFSKRIQIQLKKTSKNYLMESLLKLKKHK